MDELGDLDALGDLDVLGELDDLIEYYIFGINVGLTKKYIFRDNLRCSMAGRTKNNAGLHEKMEVLFG